MNPKTLSTPGIVVRAYPSGEADLVLRLISKHLGKVSVFARNSRKSRQRLNVNLDIFDHGMFTLRRGKGSLFVIDSFSSYPTLKNIRNNLRLLSIGSTIVEAFDLLTLEEADQSSEVYDTLALSLKALDEASGLDSFRVCFMALAELLRLGGLRAAGDTPRPSARGLKLLLAQIERHAERDLVSRKTLLEMLQEETNRAVVRAG